MLFFRSGLFEVGPESAGAHPGPACYKKGGPLTVTDANLALGRLLPEYFPQIFGPEENEPLDVSRTLSMFTTLTYEVIFFTLRKNIFTKSIYILNLIFCKRINFFKLEKKKF